MSNFEGLCDKKQNFDGHPFKVGVRQSFACARAWAMAALVARFFCRQLAELERQLVEIDAQETDHQNNINTIGLTQTTDFLPFVGHFFALRGEKMTYKRRKVPCCRRLQSLLRKSYTSMFHGSYKRVLDMCAWASGASRPSEATTTRSAYSSRKRCRRRAQFAKEQPLGSL